jgi:hypothetical protein
MPGVRSAEIDRREGWRIKILAQVESRRLGSDEDLLRRLNRKGFGPWLMKAAAPRAQPLTP